MHFRIFRGNPRSCLTALYLLLDFPM